MNGTTTKEKKKAMKKKLREAIARKKIGRCNKKQQDTIMKKYCQENNIRNEDIEKINEQLYDWPDFCKISSKEVDFMKEHINRMKKMDLG